MKRRAKEGGSKSRFSFWAAQKMLGNARKKERLGGVSGGKEENAHYAMRKRERGREEAEALFQTRAMAMAGTRK